MSDDNVISLPARVLPNTRSPADIAAHTLASARHVDEGKPLRLTGADIPVLRAVLEDYAALLAALPARTMVRAHLLTERRIWDVLDGRGRAHAVKAPDGVECANCINEAKAKGEPS